MSVKLGHFELHDQIGQGGMGTVFRAFDPSLNRNVAIKLLDEDLAQDTKFVEEFIREAQNAAAISHPHIVQIYFVGEHDGNFYLVMELLQGRSLSSVVEQDGPLAEPLALRVAIEISEALKAAYVTNQMIHGDVKPQNIYVTDNHGAKLLDFGLAKLANVEVAVSDGVWGSAYYVSPERIGQKAEDFRSDIYSLGATIFEALTGRPPFDAPTVEELAAKRLSEKPPLLRTINQNISKRTEHVINKMLAKSPLLRHLDYDALILDLRKAEAGMNSPNAETSELFRTTGHIPVVVAPKSQLPLIIIALIALVLAASAVVFVMMQKKTVEPPVATSVTPTPEPSVAPTPLPTVYGTKMVTFNYANRNAKSVSLTGNFDGWQPESMAKGSDGAWSISREVPKVVPLEYEFVVDGKAISDPKRAIASIPDGKGAEKTILIIPQGDVATPTPKSSNPRPTPKPKATPAHTPVIAVATPPPTPALDLATLSQSPTSWPKIIALKEAVIFPVVVNGRISGEIQIPAGMKVNLLKVEVNGLTVSFQGSVQKVPVGSTDLMERVETGSGK